MEWFTSICCVAANEVYRGKKFANEKYELLHLETKPRQFMTLTSLIKEETKNVETRPDCCGVRTAKLVNITVLTSTKLWENSIPNCQALGSSWFSSQSEGTIPGTDP